MTEFTDIIKGLSTPQLRAMRQVLIGVPAQASASKEVNRLRKAAVANAKLKTRWLQIEQADLRDSFSIDDEEYILSFSDENFEKLLNLFVEQKAKAEKGAVAERKSIRVPQLFGQIDLNPTEVVREGLRARRNGDGD